MTTAEKDLLLAVAEGLYVFLKERLQRGGIYSETEALGPFRELIEAAKAPEKK